MNNYRAFLVWTLILGMMIGHLPKGHTTNLDLKSHDMVISQLEAITTDIRGQKNEWQVRIRLADLYADRARLKYMNEIETTCNDCLKSRDDREKAIQNYERAIEIRGKKGESRWTLQVAHLYNLNGQPEKSRRIFEKVVSRAHLYDASVVGESYAALGEFEFAKGNYKKSETLFLKALKYPLKNPYIIKYRLAWCHFNQGQDTAARELVYAVLKDQNFNDNSLRIDISRDLVTFVARGVIDEKSVSRLMSVISDEQKRSHMFYLGQECDRLGNKSGALLVWGLYSKFNDSPTEEQLEMTIRTAQALLDKGQPNESLPVYARFFDQIKQSKCKDAERCVELKDRSRFYVTNWIKREKANPSRELLKAIEIYTQNRNDDLEILYWAGHVARRLGLNIKAAQNYRISADQSMKAIRSNSSNSSESKRMSKSEFGETADLNYQKILEGSLLGEIECAEASKDSSQMLAAYEHYLALNPDGPEDLSVMFQIARVKFEEKKFLIAAQLFHDVVLKKSLAKPSVADDIKIQAADLSIASLEKSDPHSNLIDDWAREYASLFSGHKNKYLRVSRHYLVNLAVHEGQGGPGRKPNPEKAFQTLQKVPLDGATNDERVQYYKNRIVLAEKNRNLDAASSDSEKLLAIKGLSFDDRVWAYEQLLWVAEARLDFDKALYITKRYQVNNLSEADRVLKIAVLKELAGKDARSDYEKFLKISKNNRERNIVRAKLVRTSVNPWSTLAKYRDQLSRDRNLYADTVLAAYAKDPQINRAKKYLSDRKIRSAASLEPLRRVERINQLIIEERRLGSLRLNNRSANSLKVSLEVRNQQFRSFTNKLRLAARKGEFVEQILISEVLKRELRRLGNEITQLPAPRGLKGHAREEFKVSLRQLAQPYLSRSENINEQISAMFKNSNYLDLAFKNLQDTGRENASILVNELNILARYAPSDKSKTIKNEISRSLNENDKSEIRTARAKVKEDPFNIRKISFLRDLEDRYGSPTMVTFLDARLTAIQRERL